LDVPANVEQATPANASELRVTDWPAVPARIRACLGRDAADALFDASAPAEGDIGRRDFQEEYGEWRVIRDGNGPVRFELTTELSDYWELLAAHAPATAIERVAELARTPVEPSAVFGSHDPFAATSTVEERASAFRAEMLGESPLGRPGPFNDGSKAIVCMTRHDNTLGALLRLVANSAAAPHRVVDAPGGEPRLPSGSEAIRGPVPISAQDCRNSDPVVVERVVRLATEGRLIRFDDPIGVYVLDVQMSDLLAPDGSPLPLEWRTLSRAGERQPDDLSRAQRLVIEAPRGAGFTLAEVRSRRTGEPIVHGAQLAELVQLGVYVRTGPPDSIPVDVETHPAPAPIQCSEHPRCADVKKAAERTAAAIA
ncbi:MAG: hypothetical protein M3N56_12260, partial [Actinomycetota bacterium]|nr:hypothetical protein [Actinomycetota bacterium]